MKSPVYNLEIHTTENTLGVRSLSSFSLLNIDEFSLESLVDILLRHDTLNAAIRRRLFGTKPQPKDLFIHSLACINEDGDLDHLIRALSWQQDDIAYLSSQLRDFDRAVEAADRLRADVARLKDNISKLRERNSELVKHIKSLGYDTPKKSKKDSNPCR